MNIRTKYLISAIIASVVFASVFTLIFVFELNGFFDTQPVLAIIMLAVHPLVIILAIVFFMRFIQESQRKVNLERENLYALGVKSAFFNLSIFEGKVTALKHLRRNKKKNQFLVVFSAANQQVMENANRDEQIILFNAKIADFLSGYFAKTPKSNRVFAFSKGLFYLYLFTNDEEYIRKTVNDITKALFEISETNQIHAWVQPFFGVAEMESEVPLSEEIENALIARDVSERNYESLTYYHASFRKHSSKSEIEEITNALENGEFVVYYQPKYSLTIHRFVSSEALVRWNSPKHGLLEPSKFIFIAENAGLIHAIDTYVFKKVCEDLNEAKRKGRRVIPVSINFSLHEFYSIDFLESVIKTIEESKINPSLIEIEITETTSQTNTFMASSIIRKLKDYGIRVLMDDFGVGFSNIGNLKKIPFDAVKIDKSFIDNIESDVKARAIVKFLIDLCHANDLEVIAEGVDNKEQVEVLKKAKCNTIQGFYYSRAIPKDEYEKFLISNPFEKKETRLS